MFRHPLLRMVAVGGTIFAAQSVGTAEPEALRELHIDSERLAVWKQDWSRQSARGETTLDWDQALAAKVDDELLVDQALQLNLHVSDLVVRRRLRQNLLFAEINLSADDGIEVAYDLGMPRTDPLVRRRLRQLMEMRMRHGAKPRPISGEQIVGYQREGGRVVEKYSFHHVLRSGEGAGEDVQAVIEQFPRPEDAVRRSEAFLHGLVFEQIARSRVEAVLGQSFADALAELPLNQWAGPIGSPYGQHMVRLTQRTTHQLVPDLIQVRNALLANEERKSLRQGMAVLREQYRVTIDDSMI